MQRDNKTEREKKGRMEGNFKRGTRLFFKEREISCAPIRPPHFLAFALARAFEGTTKPNAELKSSRLKHFDPLFGDRPRDKAKVSVRSSNVASKIDRSAVWRDEDGRFYVRTMSRKHSNTVSFLFSNISSSDEESVLWFLESIMDNYLAGKISKLKHPLTPLPIIRTYKTHSF